MSAAGAARAGLPCAELQCSSATAPLPLRLASAAPLASLPVRNLAIRGRGRFPSLKRAEFHPLRCHRAAQRSSGLTPWTVGPGRSHVRRSVAGEVPGSTKGGAELSDDDESGDEEEAKEERGADGASAAAPRAQDLRPAEALASSSSETSAGPSSDVTAQAAAPEKLWFPLNIFVALLRIIQSSRLFQAIANWPAWQQRKRLQQLREQADADPKDSAKQAEYLRALNKSSPEAVVERFERREHASDAQTVVEYLRALVSTNGISEYLPDESIGRGSGLPHLLQELKQRASGDSGELAPPGMTEQQPLHVVMVEGKSKSVSSKGIRILQEIIGTVLIFILFSVFWVLAATALRRYVAGVTSIAGAAGAPGGGVGAAAGVYAPKEYSKETMPEKSVKTFKDVKGCDEAKQELEEIVEYLKNPSKFTRLGGKLPKGVLLVGPPGTGKTLLAKAIAGEAGVPFFYRAGSEFEEMFVGVGARRVRALFQAAKKKAPCIVFIDEIDAVGASRKQWEGHTKKTLNQLLVEMDGFEANEGIIVIAATNLPEMLDPALTRPGRFDRHVVVPNPDIKGRKEILDLYLADKPKDDSVDSSILARGTPGFSGADLANMVNIAAVKAALDGRDHINISQLEFAKDKILMGSERKSMAISKDCRKNTAYHESGHALVALHTEGAMPIHKATITPRGMALGMVTQLPDEDYENSRTRLQMLARLDVCMGGRVAEEMIFGPDNVTSGARDDLKQATKVARHMVLECGFSDALGPMFIDPDSEKYSSDTMRKSDAEVGKLLRESYERVKKLLKKHEADLHKLAGALIERETLNADEIRELLGHPEGSSAAPALPQRLQEPRSLMPAPAAALAKSSSKRMEPSQAQRRR